MSKDDKYPVFFVTEDTAVVRLWKATTEEDPELFATMIKEMRKVEIYGKVDPLEQGVMPVYAPIWKLDQLISAGLFASPSPWTQFLTQGLYDPRLFTFFIRPFLTESNKPPAA